MSARVLFLPGSSGHGSFWDPIRERLPEFVTETVDWPGLGDVPADPDVNSYEDLVAQIIGRLERDFDGPATLVGQSMGGWVAARVAVERPDLVDRLVLAVTSAGVDMEALGATDWRPGARKARPDSPEWSFAVHSPMEDQLAALTLPVLLLWADADSISPLAVGQRLHELLADSELVVYPSDDHWVVVEYADAVAECLQIFLSEA